MIAAKRGLLMRYYHRVAHSTITVAGSSRDGQPMPAGQCEVTVAACKQHDPNLILDEAVSAVRCGAKFGHQISKH